jgi:hypothetical protein
MSEVLETVETAQDATIEALEASDMRDQQSRWHQYVALSTMIMALLAAVGGMLAGISSQEALSARTQEIIEMNYLEGDRLYVEILRSRHEILTAIGENLDPAEVAYLATCQEDLEELEANVAREESAALSRSNAHVTFAIAVTLLSLGITLGGMAVVVERKFLWIAGLAIGLVGAVGVIAGGISMLG